LIWESWKNERVSETNHVHSCRRCVMGSTSWHRPYTGKFLKPICSQIPSSQDHNEALPCDEVEKHEADN
jgi:hypothetical protein